MPRRGALAGSVVGVMVVAALAGCADDPTGVAGRPDAVRMRPLAAYASWWREVQACSGRSIETDRIAWAFVPGADLVSRADGAMVEGTYDAATRTMLIAESVAWDAATVRLLMLQALVGRDRVSRVDAYERCASVVRCEFGCAREAGAIPVNGDASDALGIDTIAPSRLRIDAVVTPGTVSRRAGIEFVRLVVSVTNPTPRAVRVMVPPSGDAGPPGGFGYAIEYGGGSGGGWSDERLWDRAQVTFGPGETKRWSFDLRVPRMPVGTHALVGSFSRGLEAPAVTVRVDP